MRMRKKTTMGLTIATILIAYILATNYPNQAFAQSKTGVGPGHVPGELAAGGHVGTDSFPISPIDTHNGLTISQRDVDHGLIFVPHRNYEGTDSIPFSATDTYHGGVAHTHKTTP